MKPGWIRQGDLMFVPVAAIPSGGRIVADGVLARGEATGHSHRLAVLENAEVFDCGQAGMFLRVSERGVSIVHEEHQPVTLPPNDLRQIVHDQEYDYSAQNIRRVVD